MVSDDENKRAGDAPAEDAPFVFNTPSVTNVGLPVDLILPTDPAQLSEKQIGILIRAWNLPESIVNDERRLRENLAYRLRLHAHQQAEIARLRDQAKTVDAILRDRPDELLGWSPVSLQSLTGHVVIKGADGVARAVRASVQDAIEEENLRGKEDRPVVRGKVHILSSDEFRAARRADGM